MADAATPPVLGCRPFSRARDAREMRARLCASSSSSNLPLSRRAKVRSNTFSVRRAAKKM